MNDHVHSIFAAALAPYAPHLPDDGLLSRQAAAERRFDRFDEAAYDAVRALENAFPEPLTAAERQSLHDRIFDLLDAVHQQRCAL